MLSCGVRDRFPEEVALRRYLKKLVRQREAGRDGNKGRGNRTCERLEARVNMVRSGNCKYSFSLEYEMWCGRGIRQKTKKEAGARS